MEIIRFKVQDYYDILEICEELINSQLDYYDTKPQNGNSYVVNNYCIVIPELHVCFREAEWYTLNNEYDVDDDYSDEGENDGWELQGSVYLLYEEKERDINQWISSSTGLFDAALANVCREANYPIDKMEELDCFIEFDV